MKKIPLFMVVVAVCFACNKTSEPPTLTGSWQSIHHYFSLTTSLPDGELKEEIEQLIDIDVAEDDSYKLTLNEGGTGSGSNVRHNGEGRYNFNISWQLKKVSDFINAPTIDKNTKADNNPFPDIDLNADALIYNSLEDGYGGVFFTYDGIAVGSMGWTIEEFTSDKLVLMSLAGADVDTDNGGWSEIHIYRYTFKKVE